MSIEKEKWLNKKISLALYKDIKDVLDQFSGPFPIAELFSMLSNKIIQGTVEYSATLTTSRHRKKADLYESYLEAKDCDTPSNHYCFYLRNCFSLKISAN